MLFLEPHELSGIRIATEDSHQSGIMKWSQLLNPDKCDILHQSIVYLSVKRSAFLKSGVISLTIEQYDFFDCIRID